MSLAPSTDKPTRNYDIECSNHHPFVWNLTRKGFGHSKMKWWAIYTNFLVDDIVRLPHPRIGKSQGRETVLPSSVDKKTRNYDIECSNRHLSLSTLRPKWLSCSKMKWWSIYTNLPMDVIVRLPQPRSGHSQGQKTFLAPSAEKQRRNYDIDCSNHHPSLSTLRPKGLSHRKIKLWAIHTNLPVDDKVRLPHPRSGNSQGQERFLAPSADKQTRNYHVECSNNRPSVSTLRPKRLSHSKMKWWAIHTNLPLDVIVKLPHPWSGHSQNQETSLESSSGKQTHNCDIEC